MCLDQAKKPLHKAQPAWGWEEGAEPTVRTLCPAGPGHLGLQGQGSRDKRALVVSRLPAVPGTLCAGCRHPPAACLWGPGPGKQGCPFRGGPS